MRAASSRRRRPPAGRSRSAALLSSLCRAGRVIHEFDPWFNYRATEYMAANGWDRFQVCAAQSVLAHATQCSLGA